MQPYFFPYAGYFRLMAASDLFVVLDDVQFHRRGRVHRCEVAAGRWLTLPLARAPRSVAINRLNWAPDAPRQLERRLERAGIVRDAIPPPLRDHLFGTLPPVLDFLENGLKIVTRMLGLPVHFQRSSDLSLPGDLRGQDRILAILETLGADCYVNAPGGRSLYQPQAFAERGITLNFLPSYRGCHFHLLPWLLDSGAAARIRAEIDSGLT